MSLTVGSLFSGIGGLDLGLERAGMRVAWQVEKDPYCRRVLAKHWPDVPCYEDVKELTGDELAPVDLICGGFPCQPVSRAGRRLAQADERWLWPEFARLVGRVRPRFVLVENVPGLLVHGMGDVLGDLARLGYDAEWESIPAAAVGAPHLRDRIWIVARTEHGRHVADAGSGWRPGNDVRPGRDAARCGGSAVANAGGERRQWRTGVEGARRQAAFGSETGGDIGDRRGSPMANAPGAHRGPEIERGEADRPHAFGPASRPGRSSWWATEPDVGRVAHGVPARVDRLRALGNAVVPQVAEYVGRRIVKAAA